MVRELNLKIMVMSLNACMAIFRFLNMATAANLDVENFHIVKVERNGQEYRTTSLCQILFLS